MAEQKAVLARTGGRPLPPAKPTAQDNVHAALDRPSPLTTTGSLRPPPSGLNPTASGLNPATSGLHPSANGAAAGHHASSGHPLFAGLQQFAGRAAAAVAAAAAAGQHPSGGHPLAAAAGGVHPATAAGRQQQHPLAGPQLTIAAPHSGTPGAHAAVGAPPTGPVLQHTVSGVGGVQTPPAGLQSSPSGLSSGTHSGQPAGSTHTKTTPPAGSKGAPTLSPKGAPRPAGHPAGRVLQKGASGLISQPSIGAKDAVHAMQPPPLAPLTRRKSAMGAPPSRTGSITGLQLAPSGLARRTSAVPILAESMLPGPGYEASSPVKQSTSPIQKMLMRQGTGAPLVGPPSKGTDDRPPALHLPEQATAAQSMAVLTPGQPSIPFPAPPEEFPNSDFGTSATDLVSSPQQDSQQPMLQPTSSTDRLLNGDGAGEEAAVIEPVKPATEFASGAGPKILRPTASLSIADLLESDHAIGPVTGSPLQEGTSPSVTREQDLQAVPSLSIADLLDTAEMGEIVHGSSAGRSETKPAGETLPSTIEDAMAAGTTTGERMSVLS